MTQDLKGGVHQQQRRGCSFWLWNFWKAPATDRDSKEDLERDKLQYEFDQLRKRQEWEDAKLKAEVKSLERNPWATGPAFLAIVTALISGVSTLASTIYVWRGSARELAEAQKNAAEASVKLLTIDKVNLVAENAKLTASKTTLTDDNDKLAKNKGELAKEVSNLEEAKKALQLEIAELTAKIAGQDAERLAQIEQFGGDKQKLLELLRASELLFSRLKRGDLQKSFANLNSLDTKTRLSAAADLNALKGDPEAIRAALAYLNPRLIVSLNNYAKKDVVDFLNKTDISKWTKEDKDEALGYYKELMTDRWKVNVRDDVQNSLQSLQSKLQGH